MQVCFFFITEECFDEESYCLSDAFLRSQDTAACPWLLPIIFRQVYQG